MSVPPPQGGDAPAPTTRPSGLALIIALFVWFTFAFAIVLAILWP